MLDCVLMFCRYILSNREDNYNLYKGNIFRLVKLLLARFEVFPEITRK